MLITPHFFPFPLPGPSLFMLVSSLLLFCLSLFDFFFAVHNSQHRLLQAPALPQLNSSTSKALYLINDRVITMAATMVIKHTDDAISKSKHNPDLAQGRFHLRNFFFIFSF
eukprot:m.147363 g.147363  ORF g.147363 m.147363 type:complete len:111 (-) comp16110_c0_seq2:48-380(-)